MGYRGKKVYVSFPLSPKYLGLVSQKIRYGTQKLTRVGIVGIAAGYYVQPGAPPQGGGIGTRRRAYDRKIGVRQRDSLKF